MRFLPPAARLWGWLGWSAAIVLASPLITLWGGPGFATDRGADQQRPPAFGRVLTASPPPQNAPEAALAKGRLLVARRGLSDPNFAETVVLLIDYSPNGTAGLILNQESDLDLAELFPEIPELEDRPDRAFVGGPVGRGGMMVLLRSQKEPPDSRHVIADTYVSSSRWVFEDAFIKPGYADDVRGYNGYAGWGPGQLEGELGRGDWHMLPGDEEIVFDPEPWTVWERLISQTEIRYASGDRPGFPRRPNFHRAAAANIPLPSHAGVPRWPFAARVPVPASARHVR